MSVSAFFSSNLYIKMKNLQYVYCVKINEQQLH